MTERVETIAPSAAPAPGRARPRAETAAPAVARVLALQRSAGNAAVTRLLRSPLDWPRVAAPPAPRTLANGRQRFAAQLRDRWGVANVRVGTEADQIAQMRRSTPDVDPSPTTISGWQEWDPGPDNDLYDDILDAFEVMGFALGGVPEVNELRFLATDYENVRGTATARPRHGATYGGGLLNVFQPTETLTWRLPQGRSAPGARAAVTAGSQSDSRRRVIVHELAHGVFERFGSPMLGGDTQFFQEWAQAAGWSGGRLEQNGTQVTDANWNEPWPEQPVSAYATTNNMEDFAESLMCFIEAPAVLSARSPARHRFIQERLGAWRAGLRQPRAFTAPLPRRGPLGDFPLPTSPRA